LTQVKSMAARHCYPPAPILAAPLLAMLSANPPPPFSPVLLAGLLLRPLPAALLGPPLAVALALMRRRHGDVFARLEPLGAASFLIDPTDLPPAFRLDLAPPSLRLVGDDDATEATATIRAPMAVLLDLLAGRIDGDAMFFSRDLVIEGDTAAVLTLRNAVDGADIDLADDMAAVLGPLAVPGRRLWALAGGIAARAARDVALVQAALLAPALESHRRQAAEIARLETALAEVRAPRRRRS